MMTAYLILGACFGGGLAIIAAGLSPARPTLQEALDALSPAADDVPSGSTSTGWVSRMGSPLGGLLHRWGLPGARLRADLAVCERDMHTHLAEQAVLAVFGFLLPPLVFAVLGAAGLGMGWQLPLWSSLACAALGWITSSLHVRAEAARRRARIRSALVGVLDLVVVSLSGGAGVEQALRDATEGAATWAQLALRRAVEEAHLVRRPPWETLGELGVQTGVAELSELAAALSLAGTEGARVRASLTSRAAALRSRQLTDAEAAALSATERMSLPVVGLFAGFLVFIGFPAVSAVMSAL